MPAQKLIITGGNGLLGTKLLALALRDPTLEPVSVSRQPCSNRFLGAFPYYQVDLTERGPFARLVAELRPRWVIHTAAMTDVDGCERDPAAADLANVVAPTLVAEACRAVDAHLVHLSTDYVFDGQAGPYGEDDPPNPLSVYGRGKLTSEAAVMSACPGAAVARTAVVYGHAPNARLNYATWLVAQLRAGNPLRIVDDQVGSPTLADNLAEMCLALALGRATGVYHTAGADQIDRLEFARLVGQVFELDASRITPISTASLSQAAVRPLKAGLKMDKFRREFPSVEVLGARAGLEVLRTQLDASG